MPLINMLKTLGVDVKNQLDVVRLINGLNLTDQQKQEMLAQYLKETGSELENGPRAAANFKTA